MIVGKVLLVLVGYIVQDQATTGLHHPPRKPLGAPRFDGLVTSTISGKELMSDLLAPLIQKPPP